MPLAVWMFLKGTSSTIKYFVEKEIALIFPVCFLTELELLKNDNLDTSHQNKCNVLTSERDITWKKCNFVETLEYKAQDIITKKGKHTRYNSLVCKTGKYVPS